LLASGSPQDLTQAAELLADFRAKAQARNLYRGLILASALQALVLSAQGQEAAALAALQEAVERAAPGGALRLVADCGLGLIPLLHTLLDAGVTPRYIQKVLTVLEGQATVPPASFRRSVPSPSLDVIETPPEPEGMVELLTNREIDVLTLLAERLTDKEIAEQLMLSPLTVKKHTQRIYRKLGVDNRRAAVARARSLGLI
jgi:LuxR family transcriptional regulator, maltose regulon positive regulatory protein